MNFELSDEQRMLKDAVERLVADRFGLENRRSAAVAEQGFVAANWEMFAELGLLGLPFGEEVGGVGGGAMELAIVMEAFGRGPVSEPYLGAVVLSGGLLRNLHAKDRLREIVPDLAAGSRFLAFAHEEDGARHVLSKVSTTASKTPRGWVLDGRKLNVLAGGIADLFLVSARSAGATADEDGISLFAVPADHPGLTRTSYRQYDSQMAAVVSFDAVELAEDALIGKAGAAYPAIERSVDEAIAAICAEAVGAMDAMLWTTVDYIKTRHQFGGPLARFQALQHRAAEMYIMLEQARSMALYAAMMARHEDRDERRRAISAAKVQICESVRFVGQQAVQLHGGIGVTEECLVGHYFRRANMIERQFGDLDHHLAVLDRLGGLDDQLRQ